LKEYLQNFKSSKKPIKNYLVTLLHIYMHKKGTDWCLTKKWSC